MAVFRLPRLPDPTHFVYAMFCRDGDGPGYVKFGLSSAISQRLSNLRVSCPIPAQWFAVVEVPTRGAAKSLESALHSVFASRRTSGEWFRFDLHEPEQMKEFSARSRRMVEAYAVPHGWWTKIDAEALDKDARDARRRRLHAFRVRNEAARRENFNNLLSLLD